MLYMYMLRDSCYTIGEVINMEEQKKRNQYAYDKKAYDHLHLQIKKGQRDKLRKVAELKGLSINAYIKQLIEQDCGLKL